MRTGGVAPTVGRVGRLGWSFTALAWLVGTALQMGQAQVLPRPWAWGLLAAFALVALLGALRGSRTIGAVFVVVGVFGLGWTHADLRAGARLQQALAPELEGRDLVLTGTVAELPRITAMGVRFVFEVETAQRADDPKAPVSAGPPVEVPHRVSLGWFQSWDVDTALSRPAAPVVAGDRWRLPVRLKRPHGAVNPHGFDLERWLFEQDLRATGHVRPGAQRLDTAVAHPLERLRQRWRDAILLRVADPAAAGVLAALAVGDQAAIDGEGWELFRTTGVAHLMSISGLFQESIKNTRLIPFLM